MIERLKVNKGDKLYFFSQSENTVKCGKAYDDGKNCEAGIIRLTEFGKIPCDILYYTLDDCLQTEHAQAYLDACGLRKQLKVVNKRKKTIELLAQKYGVFL